MKDSLGAMIATLRKDKGLTQAQLADRMGVTDKAVSKWERDLSCPDVSSIPRLAEVLGISVEQLMQGKKPVPQDPDSPRAIFKLILKVVPLAMGVAVVALSAMHKLEVSSALTMLGLGMASLALYLLQD